MDYLEKYNEWCNNSNFDEETKKELISIKNNDEEIKDRFYKDLEFGTAGLRGIIGMGTNRMNKYTVGKATQGLANFIIKNNACEKGVAIAYDSRNMSREFSTLTALILNANGIKTYLFDNVRPTPELSFAVRTLKCIAGIVITASHNPPNYNGYKVYWDDGAQINYPIDEQITAEVNDIKDFSTIKNITEEEASKLGLFNIIGKEIDDKYIEALKEVSIHSSDIETEKSELKIVYTPLHGTGYMLTERILRELGFKNLYVVEEQKEPNGNFPTVSYPNPEDPKSFELALNLAKKVDADLIVANDPDADRVGLFVKDNKTNEYIVFNGNMIGLTIAEYLISEKTNQGTLPKNSALIKTIVSSNMTDEICKANGVELFEVFTGFKNIAAKIKEFEIEKSYKNIMGYEESYGCLIGDHARDKDGIVAIMMLCEAGAFYKKQEMSLWDKIQEMYNKYGFYKEKQISIVLEGADGAEKIKSMMNKLRASNQNEIAGKEVLKIRDYLNCIKKDLKAGTEEKIDTLKSNVLYYEIEDDWWCAVRPSGTEPKIKFYMGVKGDNLQDADEKLEKFADGMKELMK